MQKKLKKKRKTENQAKKQTNKKGACPAAQTFNPKGREENSGIPKKKKKGNEISLSYFCRRIHQLFS